MVILSIIILTVISPTVLSLSITEAESNPAGTDAGNEWIEVYSESQIETNLEIMNNDGDSLFYNISFEGYYLIIFEKQFLDNSDEKAILKISGEIIDETTIFDDSKNNDETWQLCNEEWVFQTNTKGLENNCDSESSQQEPQNTTQETTNDTEETVEEVVEENVEEVPSFIPTDNPQQTEQKTETKEEKIVLNPSSNSPVTTKQGKTRLWIVYAFTAFTIIIIILMALRKL